MIVDSAVLTKVPDLLVVFGLHRFHYFMQGYGALYLVTALPLVIGISVVLILFYNSLQ